MTILDQITQEAESLPTKERLEALKAVRLIRARTQRKVPTQRTTRKTLGNARKAIKAVKGMWRDRTDLPADSVEASIELRKRVMRRGSNG